MKLYLSPAACSLADHIALHEAGLDFDRIKVDLKTKKTESGEDYTRINPKGYVPALVLDNDELLTENVAILAWVGERAPKLAPEGELGRIRLIEMLAYISTELHKSFAPLFNPASDDAGKQAARARIGEKFDFLAERMNGDWLFDDRFTVADAYLYVMLRWAKSHKILIARPLQDFFGRMSARPAVKLALQHEGLS